MAEARSLETKVEVISSKVDNISKQIDKLDSKISSGYVTKYEHEALNKRVGGVESNITWVARAVGGSIIAAIMSAVYWVAGSK